ncbi:RHS repeat-associated core domain-containing protein [Pseudomonas asturiensis]|uniref:RHS repeat-associated core domain-containing protein n=1 Tax=Pseudomonas asturiensis TaxID=1190415 RepID=A0A1M7NJZ6_9PSED|nr:RHS repeat-associated core domain-containing protein [Pseudomonas asturiensis]SHN04173.1 RHS repeat-associated core domain-containing protein [Pseudomonas asturiensis]
MSAIAPALLCRYHYDPLDQMVLSAQAGQESVQRFFQKNRLTTHLQGQTRRTLLHANEQLLALQLGQNQTTTYVLLATDQQNSVIMTPKEKASFTPYGQRHPQANPMNLPGFTGQQADPVTGHYLLGNGYRGFNPILMTFNSPDSLSPFGEGGLNAYAYCKGDPVNQIDPSGHAPVLLRLLRHMGLRQKRSLLQEFPSTLKGLKLSNHVNLGDGLNVYDNVTKKGQRELLVHAHGIPVESTGHPQLSMGTGVVSPELLNYKIMRNKGNLDNYDNIHLAVCYSADGGAHSFAGQLSELTRLPVKGYKGRFIYKYVYDIRHTVSDGDTLRDIYKRNTFRKGSGLYKSFAYEPVWHTYL